MQKKVILSQMPLFYQNFFEKTAFNGLEEIRFRVQRPIMLYYKSGYLFAGENGAETPNKNKARICKKEDIKAVLDAFLKSSTYAYLDEIKDGFITIEGGHRVGISGRCVKRGGITENIASVSGLNIRIAREFPGCAGELLEHIKDKESIKNTILISPPGGGKTTMLRDILRSLSAERRVCLVDERSEIAAMHDGIPQFDIGLQTDVLDRFQKAEGMLFCLRALSPSVIITDEIGRKEDICAIEKVRDAGCKLITSIHGYSLDSVIKRDSELLSYFELAAVLKKEESNFIIKEIIEL